MVEKKEKVIKGLVKAVNSGDFIVIHRSAKSSAGATELNAYLASVTAPKMGSSNRTEEPFAFDAREFLRDKIIGKKCEFFPEYQYGGRDYGTLIVNGENMNLAMIKSGFAKVVEKKGNLPAATNYDDLISAQTEFKQKKAGVFATDDKHIEKHTRNVTYFSDPGYNA
jgi:staphylococcal nuclease domain-containing protein 1